MPNLVIYAPSIFADNNCIAEPRLKVWADNAFAYYKPYPYFSVNLSNKPIIRLSSTLSESSCNELLARWRRTILFADLTRLKHCKYTKKEFGKFSDKVYAAGNCDHVSFWKSKLGTKFALNEPFKTDPDYFMRLGAKGLVAIELPVNISPYCGGGWSTNLGEKPWTRSYLICEVNHLDELEALLSNYFESMEVCFDSHPAEEIELVPAWNSLEGITHA